MNSQQKDKLVRERFSAVLAAGLPELYSQSLAKQISDDDELDTE
jgi:hypothetical protein